MDLKTKIDIALSEKDRCPEKDIKCPICNSLILINQKKCGYIIQCNNCEEVKSIVRGL